MMEYTDDEQIGQKVLLQELDAEPMRMINPWMPEYINVSIGRLFISWSRQLDRDIAAGAEPPLPSRDLGRFEDVMQRWITKTDAFLGTHQYELVEVLDWLLLAGAERHPWLYNVDDRNRPKKLVKCQTIEALFEESQKCMRRHPKGKRKTEIDLGIGDEQFVMELGAGYTLVQLLSPDALDVESARMKHCIGNGVYDGKLDIPGHCFFSVRDRNGQPHATVEIAPKDIDGVAQGVVRQIQGPRNTTVVPAILDLLTPALDDILCHDTPAVLPAPAPPVGRF
ncbi:hypothetical protein Kim5_CH00791 [Rhizobium sp. Kim5]|uniref:PcfJ domain-containing protein n=1 Tax=Rhizobium sp. Kim5 TaxID=2020311 RepID=UPI0001906A65|nr:PcfJ domain-containing protein [Rhizobium sp. Kim5]ARQ56899.1 hypothetical protein Kim5_CH00791 [Rhizobium sp. Kim5]